MWNTGNANVVIGWAKQRLVAGIGASVYELTGTGPTLPTALYTHPSSSWKWTAIAEGAGAIFLAGYNGAESAIYKFVLTSAGAMPTLSSGVLAAKLPTGEQVHSLFAYLGTYVAIGTNKGVRIGTTDENGNIHYGGLVIESTQPVYELTGKDRFIFATCTNQIESKSGLWRINLGEEMSDGLFPYATDLQTKVTGTAQSVSLLGASGRLVIGVNGNGSYLEHATDLEASGWFRTGYIRFNTVEKKFFKYVSTRTAAQSGSLTIETVNSQGAALTLITIAANSELSGDIDLGRGNPEESLALRFTLARSSTDATLGAVMNSWQIKALPAAKRIRQIRVPVMLYPEMRDAKGARVAPVEVYNILQDLETLENNSDTVTFSMLCHKPTRTEQVTI